MTDKARQEIVDYLVAKVGTINLNNPKANRGGVILRLFDDYIELMPTLVDLAIQAVQIRFKTEKSDSPIGTAKLTAASSKVGLTVSRIVCLTDLKWGDNVRLGDLFVEAMFNLGFVGLSYTMRRNSSHVLSITSRWQELELLPEASERIVLRGTVFTKPDPSTKMFRQIGDSVSPLIKGSSMRNDEVGDEIWVKSIDNLQRTGWRINSKVYRTLLDNRHLFVSDERLQDKDLEKRRISKVIDWTYSIGKASKLVEHDVFYQYVEVDYRGRIYYTESFMNYQGADTVRGMMKFAQGKPMTEDGKFWLAVHTASSFNQSYGINEIPEWCASDYKAHLKKENLDNISVDKMTLEDRVQWTNEHMGRILDEGTDLLINVDAEKMVSYLACCIEWAEFEEAEHNGQMFMTRIPIPIDGSNNGWQHLGAMSKDTETGKLVGLVPTEIPKDFYVETAKKLIILVNRGKVDRLKEILAAMPMKHIRKGISKRGSMTRAYSAGAPKIAESIYIDCKHEGYDKLYGIVEDDCKKLAKHLVKAIEATCTGPLDTMSYFQNLAAFEIGTRHKEDANGNVPGPEYNGINRRQDVLYFKKDKTPEEMTELSELTAYLRSFTSVLIAGNGSKELGWDTPSGFHVRYKNYKLNKLRCGGTIAGYKLDKARQGVMHVGVEDSTIPDIKGFMSGISPNIVHSYDAAHLSMIVANWTGDFGAVHDSFSCHACSVEDLLMLSKQKFIDIYEDGLFLENIKYQLLSNMEGSEDIEMPLLGDLDFYNIHHSDFFFS